MAATNTQRQRNTAIRHLGPCGARHHCYRPACRAEFVDYRTVEVVRDTIHFYCHGTVVPADSVALRMLAARMNARLSAVELDAMIPQEPSYEPVDDLEPWPDEPVIGARPRPAGHESVSLAAFLAEPDPEVPMLNAGIALPAIGTSVLAGPPKSLKTMLTMQLAICASSLDETDAWLPFLDSPIARGGPVLFVEEEGGRGQFKARLRRQMAGLEAMAPTIEMMWHSGIRLDQEPSFRRLLEAARYLEPALVILDPFAFLHGQDENKPAAMAPIMRRLSQLATEAETHVMVIHHVTKPQADRPSGRLGDRIRGASSITAGVDCLYLLERKGGDRAQLRGEFRDHEPIDLMVELDPETLLLRRIDAPKLAGKIDPDELLAFVTERGQVNALVTSRQFRTSKNTAKGALDALDLDVYEGPRGVQMYTVRTAQ